MAFLGERSRENFKLLSPLVVSFVFLIMFASCFSGVACAQKGEPPQAQVDRTTISAGESLFLNVISNEGDADVDTSVIKDFDVVSRGTSSQVAVGMNGIERKTTYSYTLMPQKSGTLYIPALPVRVDDDTQYTKPIEITVTTEKNTAQSDKDIFLTATASNATPWVGEQVVYTLTVFIDANITNAQLEEPEFSRADVARMDGQEESTEVRNGRSYKATAFRFVVTPLEAGEISVKPVTLHADMLVPTSGRNIPGTRFGQNLPGMDRFLPFTDLRPVSFRSNPVYFTAKALPPVPAGTTFSGLVGDFHFDVGTNVTSARVGDSVTMTVALAGRGNIAGASLPTITWPDGLKVYDDVPQRDVKMDNDGYYGQKTFRLALVPSKPGTLVIPSVALTYFDPAAGKYETLHSDPIELTVTGQAVPTPQSTSNAAVGKLPISDTAPQKTVVKLEQTPIRPLRRGPIIMQPAFSFGIGECLVVVLGSAFLYGFIVLIGRMRARKTRQLQQMKRQLFDRAQHALHKSESDDVMLEHMSRVLDESRAFCSDLTALETQIEKLDAMRFRPTPPHHDEAQTVAEESVRAVEALCR